MTTIEETYRTYSTDVYRFSYWLCGDATEAEVADECRVLMSALKALPEGERAALLLRIQHDLSYNEIARSLGISPSAAKVRVQRARLKLSQLASNLGGKS